MKAKHIYFLLVLLLAGRCCIAQHTMREERYSHQLWLLDSLRAFIASDLQLYVPSDFYTDWQEERQDSMYAFLYISYSDHVARDTSLHIPSYCPSESLAHATARDLTTRGYHTLVYKTAGMSSTLLNAKLLSYPDEAIAFIAFHEAIHRNMVNLGHPIAYRFEESFADVVANYACVRFARQTHLLDTAAAIRQRDIFERAYVFMNRQRQLLDCQPPRAKERIYVRCTATLPRITAGGNQFQKDRMNYPVNNAYFLRMQDYASHYFIIRRLVGGRFDLRSAIDGIKSLP